MSKTWFILGAVLLDFILGDPQGWPHFIIYMGRWIKFFEKRIRKHMKKLYVGGFFLLFLSVGIAWLSVDILLMVGRGLHPWVEKGLMLYLLYTMLAAKCLKVEVMKVVKALKTGDINESRRYLSYLVGRDTEQLSRESMIKGAIETTAENTIDGVLAPLFYMGIGLFIGLPVHLVVVYKTVNTLDSMVGYLVEPYKEIGYASAKMDDVLNYVPARLGSVCMWFATLFLGLDYRSGWKILRRDRRNHKSPNCGYPESVVAGALQIQLGGTHYYFNQRIEKPTIGDAFKSPEIDMICDTIQVMYVSEIIMVVLLIGSLGLLT